MRKQHEEKGEQELVLSNADSNKRQKLSQKLIDMVKQTKQNQQWKLTKFNIFFRSFPSYFASNASFSFLLYLYIFLLLILSL